jgi:hypothetical protein
MGGFDHLRSAVAQQKRTPGHDIINEFLSVFGKNMAALALTDEQRIRLNAVTGSDRAVNPAGDELLGSGKKFC